MIRRSRKLTRFAGNLTCFRRGSSDHSSASDIRILELLTAAQEASELRLQTAQRELKIDLQMAQAAQNAAQEASELHLQTAQRELKIDLQMAQTAQNAAQEASELRLQTAQRELNIDVQAAHAALKKDLNEVIQLSGYKLLLSMSTIFAGLLSVFVAVGGDKQRTHTHTYGSTVLSIVDRFSHNQSTRTEIESLNWYLYVCYHIHMFTLHLLGLDSLRCCPDFNPHCLMPNHLYGVNLNAQQPAISELSSL
jgi:hypothetical protein